MKSIRNSLYLILLLSLPLYAKDWKGNSDISLSGTTGNSHTRTFSLNNSVQKDFDRFTLKGKSNHYLNEDNGKLESERYLISEQLDWRYKGRLHLDYIFQRYVWDKDRTKNIQSRSSAGLGHGFDILGTSLDQIPNHRVFLELGGNYSWEGRRDDSYKEFGSARSYLVLYWDLHKNKTFIEQDVEYLYDFGKENGYRINTNSSIKRILKKHIGLKLNFEVNFDSTPIGNAKRTDTLTQLFLTVSY